MLRNPERTELKRAKPPGKEFTRLASRLRGLVRDAIEAGGAGTCRRAQTRKRLERRLSAILSKRYKDKDCMRIWKLLKKNRDRLFTFLDVEGISWNNNEAERAQAERGGQEELVRE